MDVLTTRRPSRVLDILNEAERRTERERLFAAGFMTYEAAQGFDASYRTRSAARLPLICFGLFREAQRIPDLPKTKSAAVSAWRMAESRHDYFRKVAVVKGEIRRGNTYQINYTTRQVADGIRDPLALFRLIANEAPYAAYVDGDDYAIACASPELFFRLDRSRIRCQPMKGTARRGMTQAEDRDLAAWLYRSAKNRAENVMITDMVRNDLGRIASPGSVRVPELFAVTRYPTIWQMTSTVEAHTDASVTEVLGALFPCASVTGAPKVSSMRLIESLERFPREIYTGTIGYMTPQRQAQFNVAIRTAVVDKRTGSAFYGVGSGIVADSEPAEEYAECLAKARTLTSPVNEPDFALLETMLWTPDEGVFLLDHHLRRMAESARYFGFAFDSGAVTRALESLPGTLDGPRYRVRLLQHRHGAPTIECEAIRAPVDTAPAVVGVAAEPIDPENPFLYHKTTRREVYERALHSVAGCDDVLLWNPDGHITETSIANVVVDIGGERITPALSCGLLGGTYRQWLLDRGEVREGRIHMDELPQVRGLYLINSVRGETRAELRTQPLPAATASGA